ncbi:hypothetical protein Desaf_2555 [Desulfocurvibacter africanus subsp. africanus str. Walvis Bay]|uniref:Uncharacterized protein n=1 Tax=Desulfocurvibacter africanus subsp. africanus str. Walvis Bay TaxID=690850 RepID=F3YZS2_DESAF|nr:hypothetical protein Desaf_2555 [Desulfocurvibacter africanus subsp. africanus str. Walvis Bay]
MALFGADGPTRFEAYHAYRKKRHIDCCKAKLTKKYVIFCLLYGLPMELLRHLPWSDH